tara:strand:+ start:816 stop:995 length:180 start_codon:yes stop_codon:yes gene_type:complete
MSDDNRKTLKQALKSRGLGDTVSKAIKKLSGGKIQECDACEQRKNTLNKMFPYRGDDSA